MHCYNVMFARQKKEACCKVARNCLGWIITFGAASCLEVLNVSCANEGRDLMQRVTGLNPTLRHVLCGPSLEKEIGRTSSDSSVVTRAEVTHHII